MTGRARVVLCCGLLAFAQLVGGCGGGSGLDAASRKACRSAQAQLAYADSVAGGAPEIVATVLEALGPALDKDAAMARGKVRTAIQHLAAVIRQAGLNSSTQDYTVLTQELQSLAPGLTAARRDVNTACPSPGTPTP